MDRLTKINMGIAALSSKQAGVTHLWNAPRISKEDGRDIGVSVIFRPSRYGSIVTSAERHRGSNGIIRLSEESN